MNAWPLTETAGPVTSDETLACAFRNGDDRAFTQLVERYKIRIIDYCRRIAYHCDSPEDLAQDVFIKFFQSLSSSFKDGKPVRPFLYSIAHNHCIDWLRKSKIETIPLDQLSSFDSPEPSTDLQAHRESPSVLAQRQEIQRATQAALDLMPLTYRAALTLRYRDNLNYEEIAQALNESLGNVKSLISRGRRLLQQKLQPYV